MKKHLLVIIIAILYSANLYAGFPVGKGRTVFSLAYSYFYSDHFFDNSGSFQKSESIFSSHYASVFVAHGLSRRFDVSATLPYIYESSYNSKQTISRHGFSDAQLALSYTIPNKLYNEFTSFKVAEIIPLSHGIAPMPISYDAYGMEFSINYAKGRKSLRHRGFFSVEWAYRHYFSLDGPDQYLFNIQRFTSISRYAYISYGLNSTYSTSTNSLNQSSYNASKDFYNVQLKLSLCRRIRRNMTVYLEGFVTPLGRNTGAGIGASAFTVMRIP